MQIRKTKNIAIALTMTSLLTACAGQQVAISESVQQKSIQAASESKFTPEQAISSAESALLEAKDAGLEFFSPLHLKQAEESVSQARSYLVEPPSDVKNAALMAAIAAQKYIENAYNNKKKVEGNLKASLQHLEVLKSLNAPTLVADDYHSVVSSLTEIIEEIEQGDIGSAKKNEVDLLEDMAELEISTLKVTHLGEATAFYEKANDIDADEYAELSFEKAEDTLEASINFIEKNYRDRAGVKAAGLEALLATKRAYYVALEAEPLIKLTAESAEKHVIEVMALFNKLHLETKGVDIEPEKFFNQTELLVAAINEMKAHQNEQAKSLITTPAVQGDSAIYAAPEQEGLSITPTTLTTPTLTAPMPSPHQTLEGLEDTPSQLSEADLKQDEQGFDSIESVPTGQSETNELENAEDDLQTKSLEAREESSDLSTPELASKNEQLESSEVEVPVEASKLVTQVSELNEAKETVEDIASEATKEASAL